MTREETLALFAQGKEAWNVCRCVATESAAPPQRGHDGIG